MPRMDDYLEQTYNTMGLKPEKLRVKDKKELCTSLDNTLHLFWKGIVSQWNRYKKACLVRNINGIKYAELAGHLQIKEDVLQGEVPVTKMYVEDKTDPVVLRKFYD